MIGINKTIPQVNKSYVFIYRCKTRYHAGEVSYNSNSTVQSRINIYKRCILVFSTHIQITTLKSNC